MLNNQADENANKAFALRCKSDVRFTEEKLVGISPVFRGKMGIDSTWKKGYPSPLVMSDEIIKKVDKRWDSYWK